MVYSIVALMGLVITIILNNDLFVKKGVISKTVKSYRLFLLSACLFFLFDYLWGIIDEHHWMTLLHIDTDLFFVSMSLSITLWARYVAYYNHEKSIFNIILVFTSIALLLFTIIVVIINIFNPILFSFDGNDYHAHYMRYSLFTAQILIYLLTSIYSFIRIFKAKKSRKARHLTISLFGIIMSVCVFAQIYLPLLPLYSLGCIINIVLLHKFVVNTEREEASLKVELQKQELMLTKDLVYTDSLTGAKSKHAYVEMESDIDSKIAFGTISEFAVVVFDINGLKIINDTKGHEAGDEYIKDCYQAITSIYHDTPIYRFGGDEFVAILFNDAYNNRHQLLEEFENLINKNQEQGLVVVSSGMSDYNKETDNTYRAVFTKADEDMYVRKHYLKRKGKSRK